MGYSQELRWTYGKVCRLFGEWADDHAIDYVSGEIIRAYSMEKPGVGRQLYISQKGQNHVEGPTVAQ